MINSEKCWKELNESERVLWTFFLGLVVVIGSFFIEVPNDYLKYFLKFSTFFLSFGFFTIQRYKTIMIKSFSIPLKFFYFYFLVCVSVLMMGLFLIPFIVVGKVVASSYFKTISQVQADSFTTLIFSIILVAAFIYAVVICYKGMVRDLFWSLFGEFRGFFKKLFTEKNVDDCNSCNKYAFYMFELFAVVLTLLLNSFVSNLYLTYTELM